MNSIGGYFELELQKGKHYHNSAIRLNTARNCFEYILRTRHYGKIFIPYYTCSVMLKPIGKLGLDYEFYHINDLLEPDSLPELKDNEAFLYTNYFGLKQDCVKKLANRYRKQLIVDNAQAFFASPLTGIDTFYSARKFLGVSDGAYLFTDQLLPYAIAQDYSIDRIEHLLKRIDINAEAGFQDFRKNDDSLCRQEIKQMSKLTDAILCGVNYELVKKMRRDNYNYIESELSCSNKIRFSLDEDTVPMTYPYYVENGNSLKKKLIENKIFVATYWPNVFDWCTPNDLDFKLADRIVCIPIDQRYGIEEMKRIINVVRNV